MTDLQVLEARELRSNDIKTWTYNKLGLRYGVTKQSIRAAVIGKRWGHLTNKEEGVASTIKSN